MNYGKFNASSQFDIPTRILAGNLTHKDNSKGEKRKSKTTKKPQTNQTNKHTPPKTHSKVFLLFSKKTSPKCRFAQVPSYSSLIE